MHCSFQETRNNIQIRRNHATYNDQRDDPRISYALWCRFKFLGWIWTLSKQILGVQMMALPMLALPLLFQQLTYSMVLDLNVTKSRNRDGSDNWSETIYICNLLISSLPTSGKIVAHHLLNCENSQQKSDFIWKYWNTYLFQFFS